MATDLSTLEEAFIGRELVAAVHAAGVEPAKCAGITHLLRGLFAASTEGGTARLVARSGKGVETEISERLADPSIAALTGPLAGSQPVQAAPVPLPENASFSDRAIAYHKQQIAANQGVVAANPYDPTRLLGAYNSTLPASPYGQRPRLPDGSRDYNPTPPGSSFPATGVPHFITWPVSTGPSRDLF